MRLLLPTTFAAILRSIATQGTPAPPPAPSAPRPELAASAPVVVLVEGRGGLESGLLLCVGLCDARFTDRADEAQDDESLE